MSKIDRLIAELCPNGVEYKKLEEIGIFYGGLSGKTKEDFTDGNAKYITYMNVYSNPSVNLNIQETVKIEVGEKQNAVEYGDILFTTSSETPDECGMSSVVTEKTNELVYLNSFCFGFRLTNPSKYNFHFLKHLFRSHKMRKDISKTACGVTRYNVSKKRFSQIIIPIPPLEIQQQIVRILDNFTNLKTNLQAELQARKEQYEYYRNAYLTFDMNDINVEWTTLGKVCKFVRGPFGGALKKECFQESGFAVYEQQHAIYGNFKFRYFVSEEKFKELKRFEVSPNDLIVSCSGTMGRIAIIPSDAPRGIINQALLKLTVGKDLNVKYLKYFFENTITKQLNDDARGGAIKNVASVDVLKKIEFPVPSLSEQERIVSILDKFEELVNDTNNGLPAEIEALQEQYEYYREKLLTFDRMA